MNNPGAIIGVIGLLVWGMLMGLAIGSSNGYDKGSQSTKSIYQPELEKSVQSLNQLREAAVSYGYAEWVVMNNTNGNTEFRWKTKSIKLEE
jgi:hypothetical protein